MTKERLLEIFKIFYLIWFSLSVLIFSIWVFSTPGVTEKEGEKYYFNNHGSLTEITKDEYQNAHLLEIIFFVNHFIVLGTGLICFFIFQIMPFPGFTIKGKKIFKEIESD